MNFTRSVLFSRLLPLTLALSLHAMPSAHAVWNGATTGTSGTAANMAYLTTTNWTDSTIDDSFSGVTLTGNLVLTANAGRTLTAGMNFNYSGAYNLTLRSNTTSARTFTLNGDVSFQPAETGRLLTLGGGAGTQLIHLNTNGTNRSITVSPGNELLQYGQLSGGNTIIKKGGGVFDMRRGTANDFNLQVDAGEFKFGGVSVFPSTGKTVTVNDGGTLSVGAFNQANSYTVNLNGGAFTTTSGGTSTLAAFSSTGGGDVTVGGLSLIMNTNVTYSVGDANKSLTITGGTVSLNGGTRTFTVADDGDLAAEVIISSILSSGGVSKAGAGVMRLSGVNSYTGATTVSAGTLEVSGAGDINSTSGVTVEAGGNLAYNSSTALTVAPTLSGNAASNSRAILSGTGTINAALTLNDLGDVLSPGNSPGILTFSTGQTWTSYTYDWEVNSWTGNTAGTNFDRIDITGGLTLAGSSYRLNILSLTSGNVAGLVPDFTETTKSWTILTTTGGITGFDALEWDLNTSGFTNIESGTWSLAQNGNNLELTYTAQVVGVPEPSTILLLAAGGVFALCRRKRAARA